MENKSSKHSKRRLKQLVSASLALAITTTSLTGCNFFIAPYKDNDLVIGGSAADVSNDSVNGFDDGIKLDGADLINLLGENYVDSSLNEIYSRAEYEVHEDYVFELGQYINERNLPNYSEAFSVYCDTDLKELDNKSLVACNIELVDGTLRISPLSSPTINADGNIENTATWGMFSKLYLVQNLDWSSGWALEKKRVTPFLIKHDLEAPVLTQGLDENNHYKLSWTAVDGAKEYIVYSKMGSLIEKQYVTSDTECLIDDFEYTKKHKEKTDAFSKDLQSLFPDIPVANEEMNTFIGRWQCGTDDDNLGFMVVAVGKKDKKSGTSNICKASDIANTIPYQVDMSDSYEVTSIYDLPTYLNVKMCDGTNKQMLIDYNGASGGDLKGGGSVLIVKIKNTDFSNLFLRLDGIDIDTLSANKEIIHERMERLDIPSNTTDINMCIPETPSNSESEVELPDYITDKHDPNSYMADEEDEYESGSEEDTEETEEVTPEVETETNSANENAVDNGVIGFGQSENTSETEEVIGFGQSEDSEATKADDNTDEIKTDAEVNDDVNNEEVNKSNKKKKISSLEKETPDGYTTEALYEAVADSVSDRLNEDDMDEYISNVFWAQDKLGAWLGYSLLTNQEVIPVPVSIYPDAQNTDYLIECLTEAYRQNPMSGVITDIGYNYEYESLVVNYAETWDQRKEKALQEIETATEIGKEISENISNSDVNTSNVIYAINQYLCNSGNYDMDSCETDANKIEFTEQFIDAHTPYGILVKSKGVCESYAEAFALIARLSGYDTILETGYLLGEPHEWCRIRIDENWYIVDVTNNDIDNCPNALLCVSEDTASKVLAPDGTAYRFRADAVDNSLDYYEVNNLTADNIESAAISIVEQLNDNGTYGAVRMPEVLSEAELKELAIQVLNEYNDSNLYIYNLGTVYAIGK